MRGFRGSLSWAAAGVIVAAGAAVGVPVPLWVTIVVVLLVAFCGLVGLRAGEASVVDASVAVSLLWVLIRVPTIGIWPIPAALAIVGALLFAISQRRSRAWRSGFRVGRIDAVSAAVIVGVVVAVAVATASFAVAHLQGVPNGPVGVGMVLLWGIALTFLRIRTGGMLATYLAHIAADATIAIMLGAFTVAARG